MGKRKTIEDVRADYHREREKVREWKQKHAAARAQVLDEVRMVLQGVAAAYPSDVFPEPRCEDSGVDPDVIRYAAAGARLAVSQVLLRLPRS